MNDFTPDQAIVILNETIETLKSPENVKKLEELQGNLNNGMLKMMQTIFPFIVQIQMDIIKNHGFPEGREGMVQFSQLIRSMERENAKIARLNQQIRKYYLPQVNVNSVSSSESNVNNSSMELITVQTERVEV